MLHKHIVVNSNAPRSKMNVAIFARETDVQVEHSHGMAGTINVSHASQDLCSKKPGLMPYFI